jgi:heptaprenyl diphosphate synthase
LVAVKLSEAAANVAAAKPVLDPARCVRADLERAETRLATLLDSREPMISEICHYLVDGGGKRLRPLFVLLVYRACGGNDDAVADAIDSAIALELIHSATLLHDDIIDVGMMRRGKPSAFARYGAAASLIAGDFLFCRAFELCGRFDERLVRTAAHACIQLTEGEVMEGRLRHQTSASMDEYLAIITRKTASLFAAGGRVAADLAGAAPPLIDTMERLGLAVGRAFQMVDDLLDVVSSEEQLGKPVGSDLRAGVLSLPVVIGLAEIPEVRRTFANGAAPDNAMVARALELMRGPRVARRARAMIAAELAAARELLIELDASPYRDGLSLLVEEQIDRKS